MQSLTQARIETHSLAKDVAWLSSTNAEAAALRSTLKRQCDELQGGLSREQRAHQHSVVMHADALEARWVGGWVVWLILFEVGWGGLKLGRWLCRCLAWAGGRVLTQIPLLSVSSFGLTSPATDRPFTTHARPKSPHAAAAGGGQRAAGRQPRRARGVARAVRRRGGALQRTEAAVQGGGLRCWKGRGIGAGVLWWGVELVQFGAGGVFSCTAPLVLFYCSSTAPPLIRRDSSSDTPYTR